MTNEVEFIICTISPTSATRLARTIDADPARGQWLQRVTEQSRVEHRPSTGRVFSPTFLVGRLCRRAGADRFCSGVAAAPAGTAAGEDYYDKLGVPKIINAAGTYTTLTAACMPPEVLAAVQKAALHPVRLHDLQ